MRGGGDVNQIVPSEGESAGEGEGEIDSESLSPFFGVLLPLN